nr:hypothetical protein [Neorhizobium tomejilense]
MLPLAAGASGGGGLANASAAEIIASSPPTSAFAIGATGGPATSHFSAGMPRETFARWCDRMGFPNSARPLYDEVGGDPAVGPDLKPCCARCGENADVEHLRAIGDDLVCLECLTYGESVIDDEERGMRELSDFISVEGEAEARDFITLHEDFDVIGEDRWARAAEMAAARAA